MSALALGDLPPAHEQEAVFITNARQLIFHGARSGEGYFNSDGSKMVFQSEREPGNPFFQIYTLDLHSGDTVRVSPGKGKTTCGWIRPHTGEVLFGSTHLDQHAEEKMRTELEFRASGQQRRYAWDYDTTMDLFVASPDGKKLRQLTDSPGYDAEGAYSPDGTQIVFSSLRSAYPLEQLSDSERKRYDLDPAHFGEIYLMNADGSNVRRLTNTPGYDGGPFFSADGSRIIWRRFGDKGLTADIFSMNLDGSDVVRMTDFGAMSWAPMYHPSGAYAIFASNKHGFTNFELFIVDAAGEKEPVRVTFTNGFDGLATFTPDGTKLSWTSGRTTNGESQIFLASWNHEAALKALSDAPKRTNHSTTQSTIAATPTTLPSTTELLQSHVEYLASDAMEGRLTGSDDARRAAEYLADHLRKIGAKPLGDAREMLLPFMFSSGVNVNAAETKARLTTFGTTRELDLDKDFRPLAFSKSGEVSGQIVFAGYGLGLPGQKYDSFAGLDVKDKVVLVLGHVPQGVDASRRDELTRYSGIRYKAMMAHDRGAKAVLVVTGPSSPGAGQLLPFNLDRNGSAAIPVLSISGEVAQSLFMSVGKDLGEIQSKLDVEDPHASGFPLGATIDLSVKLDRQMSTCSNVVAVIPPGVSGENPEYVLIGAHYDHLGFGEVAAMNRPGEEGLIHNGADDNASGVAVVLELARRFKATEARRGLIVGLWSGEEMGLLGSTAFAENPPLPIGQIVAYLNFDMVGRLRDNRLVLQGTGSSDVWSSLIEKRNVAAEFDLVLNSDPFLPTDSTPFYTRGVPVLNFFTASHDDYHRPTDDSPLLNIVGMSRITTFAAGIVDDLSKADDRPNYIKIDQSEKPAVRAQLRVYLGTIPDYTQEVEGVKIAGARPGSPAEKAGLLAGDIITELAGRQIKNIYDYTFALDTLKVGEETCIKIRRGDNSIDRQITPATR